MGVKNIQGELRVDGVEVKTKQPAITATFKITAANTRIDIKASFGKKIPTINWGDGTIDNKYSHTYAKTGEYTCQIFNVTTIGERAFTNCNTLTSVAFGEDLTLIDNNAFYSCNGLTSITIPKNTCVYDYAFTNCYNLTLIHFNSLASFTGGAFIRAGSSTENVTAIIGAEVARIPLYLFEESNITELIFEEGSICSYLGDYSIYKCNRLKSITLTNPVPARPGANQKWRDFGGSALECIYVPYGCAEIYKTTWAEYGAPQSILDLIVESDREAMMSDLETSMASLEKLVDGLTDAQITALNNFAKSLVVTEE